MSNLHIAENLSLPKEAVTQTFAVLAKRGVGKTYTGCVMTEEMLAAGQQVVVVDPIGVWWGLRSSADGKRDGFPIIVFGGEHADVPLEENAGEVIAAAIVENGFSAILDLSLLRKAAQVRFMTAFAETLYRLNRKPLHLMMDEADAFAPQRPLPGEQRLLGSIEDIVRRGRARGIGVTLITQRAAVLNKNVLTQIEVLVVLRTISPQDREAIEAWTEIHGTPKQLAALAETMASLPIGTAWFWSPGWLDIFKKVQVRQRRTFDSSSTPKVGESIKAPKQLAPVDLDQLGTQIKETAAKARENDPAQLKRTIADQRKQIAALEKRPAAIAAPAKTREIPVLSKPERARLDKLVIILPEIQQGMTELIGNVKDQVDGLRNICVWAKTELDFLKAILAKPPGPAAIAPVTYQSPRALSPRPPVTRPVAVSTPNGETGWLPPGERKCLIAAAQYPGGVTRQQMTILTGFKRSTRDAYIARLFQKTFVFMQGDKVLATSQGITALGNDYEPLPTGQALQEYWRHKLPAGERAILEIALAAQGNPITRDSLEESTGFKRSTRDAYIMRSISRRVLEASGPGEIRAAREFFE